jgi:hypothetical protein
MYEIVEMSEEEKQLQQVLDDHLEATKNLSKDCYGRVSSLSSTVKDVTLKYFRKTNACLSTIHNCPQRYFVRCTPSSTLVEDVMDKWVCRFRLNKLTAQSR